MRILVTGSAGHLGEALMRTLQGSEHDALGVDVLPSAYTQRVGSIADREFVRACMPGVQAVLHAATLHKPHVATHARQAFVDTNVTGTLNLLEEAAAAGVRAFVFTSTTSAFGRALVPPPGEPAAWITEDVVPVPKNIYGATKVAAEDLCELVHRDHGLPCVVLRTSRFFPEDDDDHHARSAFDGDNLKVSEFLYRRVDIEDVVDAHLLAIRKARRHRLCALHHQRHHAVHARRPARAAPRRRRRGARAACRTTRPSTRAAAGPWCRRSIASTSTSARAANSAGGRATTSPR